MTSRSQQNANELENAIQSTGVPTDYGSAILDVHRTTIAADVDSVDGDTVEIIEIDTEWNSSYGYQRFDNELTNPNQVFIGTVGSLDLFAVPSHKGQHHSRRAMDIPMHEQQQEHHHPQHHHHHQHHQKQQQQQSSLLKGVELLLNVLAQMFIAYTTAYMTWLCVSRGLAGTSLHAWLVTIGFICLMAEGVMVHYNSNILTGKYQRNRKTTIHWMLQSIGGFLGTTGALIKCIQKGFLLHTVHGKLGFVATVLCVLTMLTGMSALYSMRLKQFLSPLQNKTFHNLMGLTTFVLAMLAQFYGYSTGYYQRLVSHEYRLFMQYMTIVGLVLCCIGPAKALVGKIKSLIRQM